MLAAQSRNGRAGSPVISATVVVTTSGSVTKPAHVSSALRAKSAFAEHGHELGQGFVVGMSS